MTQPPTTTNQSSISNPQSPISNLQSPTAPTLYATVIKLRAARAGNLPGTQGRLINAAFLDIIRAVDPALSQTLHELKGRKPYALSPLQDVGQPQRGRIRVGAGQPIWLRFTLLHPQLFATFTRYLLSYPSLPGSGAGGEAPTIRIGNLPFIITEMLTTPGSHPWAGYTTVEQLRQKLTAAAEQNAKLNEIKIHFASPTAFSLGDKKDGLGKRMEPFPTPRLFFGSLASIWREVLPGGVTLKQVEDYAERTVVIGLYDMRSRYYRFWRQPQIGAEGAVTYVLRDQTRPQMTHLLNLLAELSFYSGVGYKTAMGMGQVRRIAA